MDSPGEIVEISSEPPPGFVQDEFKRNLSNYLEALSLEESKKFLVPESYLDHPGYNHDIVDPTSSISSCFTKVSPCFST